MISTGHEFQIGKVHLFVNEEQQVYTFFYQQIYILPQNQETYKMLETQQTLVVTFT